MQLKVFVIGAGTMGSGIAQVFAQNGYKVFMHDVDDKVLKNGLNLIEKNLSMNNIDKEFNLAPVSNVKQKRGFRTIKSMLNYPKLITPSSMAETKPSDCEKK